MALALAVLAFVLAGEPGRADQPLPALDYRPYPDAKITQGQWIDYFTKVKASF